MQLPPHRLVLTAMALTAPLAAQRPERSLAAPPDPTPGVHAQQGNERELSDEEQVRHALSRLSFGPRPGDVAQVQAIGVDRWIERQLRPDQIDDREMDAVLVHFPTIAQRAGALMRDFPRPGALLIQARLRGDTVLSSADTVELRRSARQNRRFVGDLMSARVARAVGSERQLQEVMTDFWLNHFSVFVGKGQLRYHLPDYERETIRPHTLGKFRDLLGAVTKSPAMLLYLDNALSVADSGRPTLASRRDVARRRRLQSLVERRAGNLSDEQRARLAALQARRPSGLNENYARELLELHTLGVDGGYTQQDIVEVARALTGWTIRPARAGAPEFVFNGAAHDAGEKIVLGTRLEGGRGIEDGERVLDLLTRHPATAHFIARKLATRFVSDAPPPALVERAAETFRRTDGDLSEVVRTIVTSPEFFSRDVYRAKVKSPFEVVVSAARAVGARPDTTAVSALLVGRLGQPIYGHQAPDGWPETGEAWMNTGAILQRINFGLAVAANRVPGARPRTWEAYQSLRVVPREAQVDAVIRAFLGGEASPDTRAVLASGEHPMLGQGEDSPPLAGLDQVIGLALGSPEFQRR